MAGLAELLPGPARHGRWHADKDNNLHGEKLPKGEGRDETKCIVPQCVSLFIARPCPAHVDERMRTINRADGPQDKGASTDPDPDLDLDLGLDLDLVIRCPCLELAAPGPGAHHIVASAQSAAGLLFKEYSSTRPCPLLAPHRQSPLLCPCHGYADGARYAVNSKIKNKGFKSA